MGWEWNRYGEPELQGYVWVDGKWSWGAVHMWRLLDLTSVINKIPDGTYVPPHQRNYFWVCTHWWWSRRWGKLSFEEMHTMEAIHKKDVEFWMLHKLTKDVRVVASQIQHSSIAGFDLH